MGDRSRAWEDERLFYETEPCEDCDSAIGEHCTVLDWLTGERVELAGPPAHPKRITAAVKAAQPHNHQGGQPK